MLALNVDLYLRRRPKSFLMALGFILLGLIGEMDYWTGREISLSIFYLVPIFLVTWYVDRRSGALISVAGALVWYIVDWMGAIKYSQSSYPYW
ncbi:MAG: hypothetical protein HYY65_07145, partial [Candidatus Tectomicrobia bacterium]|nr:hypothetical protein [Candidatus Tectomicrobia bacterium]